MNCPRCNSSELTPVAASASAAHMCPSCEGLWVQKDTLLALATVPREALEASPLGATMLADHEELSLAAKIACPVCNGAMLRYTYCYNSGITLDRCPEHGIWLDDGELSDVLDYLAGLDPDVAPEVASMSQKNRNFVSLLAGWADSAPAPIGESGEV